MTTVLVFWAMLIWHGEPQIVVVGNVINGVPCEDLICFRDGYCLRDAGARDFYAWYAQDAGQGGAADLEQKSHVRP